MILDTHTHFYDTRRDEHYWPPEEAPFPNVCLPEVYREALGSAPVTGTVIVEASPQLVDNHWILSLCDEDDFLVGFVGNLAHDQENFEAHLRELAAHPKYVGIRRGKESFEHMDQIRLLKELDLELDILADAETFAKIPAAIDELGEIRVVINHIGMHPVGNGLEADWVASMEAVKEYPSVYCKVSAMLELYDGNDISNPAEYLEMLDFLWENFGEDRLVFGTNWPVCSPHGSLETIYTIVNTYFAAKGDTAREKFFYKNAVKAYKLQGLE
ncbi:MAG: amidohydrolase family protein [Lentisphaeria bacterium]|nr:amidohydrolase family protein [Lentisphaeria bacterium]